MIQGNAWQEGLSEAKFKHDKTIALHSLSINSAHSSSSSHMEFEVERIIRMKAQGGKQLYLVKWAGFSEKHNSWEPRENLTNCSKLLREFDQQKEKKTNSKHSLRSVEKQTKMHAKLAAGSSSTAEPVARRRKSISLSAAMKTSKIASQNSNDDVDVAAALCEVGISLPVAAVEQSESKAAVRGARTPLWTPPASPHGILQETYYTDTWKLLVVCMFCNKTRGKQARPILAQIFERWPSPQDLLLAKDKDIFEIISCLGLGNRRTAALKKMSRDYQEKDWSMPHELFGIGEYATDAYRIFTLGQWRAHEVQPKDRLLKLYVTWLRSTHAGQTSVADTQSSVTEVSLSIESTENC